jgi:ATP-dependent helicase/nuclease subunit A
VVFVSGLSKPFNQMDTNDRLVVHPDLGMGLVEIEGQPKVKKNSLFRSQIADRLRRENQGEELRILYVALTRAKEKLILSGVIKDEAKTLSSYTGNVLPGKPISYRARVGASAYLDWIFPAMLSYPQKYTIAMADPGALVWESIAEHEKNRMDRRQLMRQIKQADEALVEQYDILFSYEYPYQSEAGKKSKYSVSELKHDSMVRRYDRMEGEAEVPEFLLEEREPYVPDFAKAEGRASADTASHARSDSAGPGAKRGTAVHRVMECLDFEALSGVDRRSDKAVEAFVQSELARMLASGDLPAEWHALVPPAMIESFAKSPVAGRMAEAAVRGDLYREKPFVMQHEDVLVQGIIDAFWLEKDALVLLDYKTDRVQTADELVLRYRTQLELYADALARVFSSEKQQRTAQEKLLYSFRLQEVIAV